MAEFDNAELLTDIRDRGSLPSADLRFSDTKLLSAATIELRDVITALLVEAQAERQVYLSDVAVTAGTATYRLPSRSVAGRWQSVGWKGTGDSHFMRLRQLSPSDYYLQGDEQGTPYGFFVRDNNVILIPTPNRTGTLRLPYYLRPGTLVASSAYALVESVDVGANTITVPTGTMPPAFGGVPLDVVRATPGFETLIAGVVATAIGDVVTFGGDVSAELERVVAGDYVCLAGQSGVAQCPAELRGLLATRAARRALMAVNEAQQASMLDSSVAELTEVARTLLAPRVDDEPREWGDARRGALYGLL